MNSACSDQVQEETITPAAIAIAAAIRVRRAVDALILLDAADGPAPLALPAAPMEAA